MAVLGCADEGYAPFKMGKPVIYRSLSPRVTAIQLRFVAPPLGGKPTGKHRLKPGLRTSFYRSHALRGNAYPGAPAPQDLPPEQSSTGFPRRSVRTITIAAQPRIAQNGSVIIRRNTASPIATYGLRRFRPPAPPRHEPPGRDGTERKGQRRRLWHCHRLCFAE